MTETRVHPLDIAENRNESLAKWNQVSMNVCGTQLGIQPLQ